MTEPITHFDGEHRWLSNFWLCPVVLDDRMYASVEHAFQAHKAANVTDHLYVALSPTAGQAKRRGRTVELREDWDQVKVGVMRRCLYAKFAPGTDLAQQLLDTGDAELVEGNTWGDRFWGVCNGVGENYLGQLLMEVREALAGRSDG